jgi:AcrR family transcriptional regulator
MSSERTAPSIRARVRAELTDEIKTVARRHLASDGANLSLRAVARDIGMVSSAVYRYFPSRDDLLTALIIDAYNSLGEAVERAEAAVERAELTGRWLAACRAARAWALSRPHEYALIYGSPVPGYRAPADTVTPANRLALVIAGILRDGVAAGSLHVEPRERLPKAVRAELARVRDFFSGVPEPIIARGVTGWLQLFGFISFELFGQFNNFIADRDAYFEHEMRRMAELIGLNRSRR